MEKILEEIKKEIQNDKKIIIIYDKASAKLKDNLLLNVIENINKIKDYLKVLVLNADEYLEKELKKIDDKMIMSLNVHEDVYRMINENSYKFDYYVFDNIRDNYSTIFYAFTNREGILTIELENGKSDDTQIHKMNNLIRNDIGDEKLKYILNDKELRIFMLSNNLLV